MKSFKCLNCNKDKIWSHRSINKYCDNKCQLEYQRSERIRQWLEEGKDFKGQQIPKWVKHVLESKHGNCCSVCKITEYCSKPIVLEVDHIDGDHTNNNVENLRLICPNCHSQTSTYKNRNKGNGRTSRRSKV
jgi:hypothetical protein